METSRYTWLIVSVLFILSCNPRQKEMETIVKEWQGKEIIFPDSLRLKIQEKDTLYHNLFAARYKIIHYIDTSGCTACQTKPYEWYLLQHRIDSMKANVSFIFVAWVKEFDELESLLRINRCQIPCIYDPTNTIGKLNRFPTRHGLQTFLLDSLNRVVVIGNPVENTKIQELYLKEIKSSE